MDKKPTILHISPFFSPNVGGVETHLDDLITYLNEGNYSGYVLTYQALTGVKLGKKREKRGSFVINRVPWISGLYYKTAKHPLLHFIYLTPWLLYKCFAYMSSNKDKIDVIHTHGINAAYVGALLSRIFQKNFVVSMHVDFHFNKSSAITPLLLWPLKKADNIMVLTNQSKTQLVENGIDETKVNLYSYWVDQWKFKALNKNSSRKIVGIKDTKFTVLFVGRLAKEKGVEELIKVARKLHEVNFVFAGSGEFSESLTKLASKNDNIYFAGRVDNIKLPVYYSASDVLVVPSLVGETHPTFEEGVPRVLIEALSCGLPVLGTDNGGIKDVIENGKVGIVVRSDSASISQAITRLKSNPELLSKYKLRARKYAVDRFSKKVAHVFDETYLKAARNLKVENLLENTGDMVLKRRAKIAIRELELKNGDSVLDVGCGDGFYLHLLSSLGLDLTLVGSDFDKKALDSAKKNLKGKNIKLVHADLMKKLPFKSGIFNKVIMSEVAEHLPDDQKGLKEVYRVLKPGGVLCLTVPNSNYPFFWDPVNWLLERFIGIHVKSGFWAGIWNQHVRLYTPKQISKVLRDAGFEINKDFAVTRFCIPFNHNLLNLAARRLYGGNVSKETTRAISKFEIPIKRPEAIDYAFKTINTVDRLNDFYSSKENGVSVFVKAVKPLS